MLERGLIGKRAALGRLFGEEYDLLESDGEEAAVKLLVRLTLASRPEPAETGPICAGWPLSFEPIRSHSWLGGVHSLRWHSPRHSSVHTG